MPIVTIVLGLLLIGLGVGGFVGTGSEHYTAFIPAGFGVIFVLLGALARNERMLKHAMHAAAMLGLIGFLMPAIRLAVKLSAGDDIKPVALWTNVAMAVLCAIFVGLCIKSFIDARRRRTAGEAGVSR